MILKEIFFLIFLPVLNLTTAMASTECCLGCDIYLNSFALSAWRASPCTSMRLVRPGDMVVGKRGSYLNLLLTPSGHLISTDITEQSFEPVLVTNKSKKAISSFATTRIKQFSASNSSFARFGQKMDFIFSNKPNNLSKKPNDLSNKRSTPITAGTTTVQNIDLSDTDIPLKYILYEWAFFILIGWLIIDEILRQVKKRVKNSDFAKNINGNSLT